MSPRKQVAPTPLGGHIIRRRKERDWTTADLAREAGLSYSTIRNIEKGMSRKPAEWILRQLIKTLGCDEGTMFALANYGEIPERTLEQIVIALDELGDEAGKWRDELEFIKTQPVEEQRHALKVLRAALRRS